MLSGVSNALLLLKHSRKFFQPLQSGRFGAWEKAIAENRHLIHKPLHNLLISRIWGILLGLYRYNGKENGNYYNNRAHIGVIVIPSSLFARAKNEWRTQMAKYHQDKAPMAAGLRVSGFVDFFALLSPTTSAPSEGQHEGKRIAGRVRI